MNARPELVEGRAVALAAVLAAALLAAPAMALAPEVLRSAGSIPPDVAGRFRDPTGFQQASWGQYYVFDRRAHAVFGIEANQATSWQIVKIGSEEGNIIDPSAIAIEPKEGSFAVADAPNGRERIQLFSRAGFRVGGFLLPGRLKARVVLDRAVLNGIGSLQYTGTSILISQPDSGALITEYTLAGIPNRSIGSLRRTGHEADRELHFALNSGIPLVDPDGGFIFVFQTGVPTFQKYDRDGRLLYERLVQGREIDPLIANLPTTWPKRQTADGEMPLVTPTVRAAAVDPQGRLWMSFVLPYTYVFDRDGDKVRTVQFRGAGIVAPNSLSFGRSGRILVTPGLYEFDPGPAR